MQTSIPSAARWSLLLFIVAGPAHGDAGDVFNITLGQTFGHDSNVFKLSEETDARARIGTADPADRYASTSIRLTADKRIGRQMLHGATGLTEKRYDRFKRFDSSLRDYSLGWDWQFGHLWSGNLSTSRTQTTPGFEELRATVSDVVTSDAAAFRALLAFHPDWRLVLGATASRANHSAAVNSFSNTRVSGADYGLRYAPGSGREVGVRWRSTNATYPNAPLVGGVTADNSYRENAIDFDTGWETGGKSRMQLGLGRVDRQHRQAANRDYAGQTGSLAWNWSPTVKTSLGINARQALTAADGLSAASAKLKSYGFSLGWQPTVKLALTGALEYRQREAAADPAAAQLGLSARLDDERTGSLGISYTPWRDVRLNATWRTEQRDSNTPGFSYKAKQVILAANVTF